MDSHQVFISWSGPRSHAMAQALHEWLPEVIQTVRTWLSSADIEKGTRWAAELATQLQDTKIGIICLTRDNLSAPWLLFEAGALSKTVTQAHVCPFVLDVEPVDITGPLSQFQLTRATVRDDTLKLVLTIHSVLGESGIEASTVERQFSRVWPEFEKKLRDIPESSEAPRPSRPDREVLEEILGSVRTLEREIIGPAPADASAQRLTILEATNAELAAAKERLRQVGELSQRELAHNRHLLKELEARDSVTVQEANRLEARLKALEVASKEAQRT
jgi:TIR domain